MQTIVISLGGSLVNPGRPNFKFLKAFSKLLLESDFRFGIVVGGGAPARKAAEKIRKKGGSEFEADEVAIFWTRKNALTVAKVLGKKANQKIPEDFSEAKKFFKSVRFLVMGGTIPGITTDSDAVLLAESLNSKKVINISKIDGIYSKNPTLNPDAKKFKRLSYKKLISLSSKSDKRLAGTNFVFDSLACKLAARSKIELHFVGGDLNQIKNAIEGKPHSGTVVK